MILSHRLNELEKKKFQSDLDEVMQSMPRRESPADFNGHEEDEEDKTRGSGGLREVSGHLGGQEVLPDA